MENFWKSRFVIWLLVAIGLALTVVVLFMAKNFFSYVAPFAGWTIIVVVLGILFVLLTVFVGCEIISLERCPKGGFHRREKNMFYISSQCCKCGKILDNPWMK